MAAFWNVEVRRLLQRAEHRSIEGERRGSGTVRSRSRAMEPGPLTSQRGQWDPAQLEQGGQGEDPGGPKRLFSQPARRDRYRLLWPEFAPSFVQDLESWLERLRGEDLLATLPFKPLRPISIGNRRAQVRELASGWVRRGNDPATLTLADLIRPEVAREALKIHLERRRPDKKPTRGIFHYTWALLAIARHWARADEATIAELQDLAGCCKPEDQGVTAKKHAGSARSRRPRAT